MIKDKKHTWGEGLLAGSWSLLIGLKTTLREFFTKKSTECYPENRETLRMFDRFRGQLVMPTDENGENRCVSCGLCQIACPNDTIAITSTTVTDEEGKKRKVLDTYVYDLGSCMFCQLCVNACPHDAIRFDNSFEHAVYTRNKLVIQLNKKPK